MKYGRDKQGKKKAESIRRKHMKKLKKRQPKAVAEPWELTDVSS